MKIELRPIGTVRQREGRTEIVVERTYADGLQGVESGQNYWVLYWMHRLSEADRHRLQVHPQGDRSKPQQGVFSLRSPMRPNPIGLTRVTVTERHGTVLVVEGLDALEGSPVLDLKPCLPGEPR